MSVRRLKVDPAFEPAAWIANEGASAPSLMPAWPESQLIALVVVIRQNKVRSPEGGTAAFIVTTEPEMRALASEQQSPKLWFTIPWRVVEPCLPKNFKAEGSQNDASQWIKRSRQAGPDLQSQ